jgi:hypothetical protein
VLAQIGEVMPSFNQMPDKRQSFGYKVSWFAVRASDPAAVLDAFELEEATPANWESGLAAAYDDHCVFVSPPVSGWILAVSSSWSYPVAIESLSESQHDIGRRFEVLFSRLMKRFDDVQFFGSYRVVGFVAWARALNGKPIRIYANADEVLANLGEQTSEEAKLGFADVSGLSPSDAWDEIFRQAEEQEAKENALVASGLSRREARERVLQNGRNAIPDETDVPDLAALWSLDPMQLSDQEHPLGLGLAARLPEDLAQ